MKVHSFTTSIEGELLQVISNNPEEAIAKVELFYEEEFGIDVTFNLITWDYQTNVGVIYDG